VIFERLEKSTSGLEPLELEVMFHAPLIEKSLRRDTVSLLSSATISGQYILRLSCDIFNAVSCGIFA
jgi:hypothetical protein